MVQLSARCRARGLSGGLLGLVAVVAALAAAPAVHAEDGTPVATAEAPQSAPAAAPASSATDGDQPSDGVAAASETAENDEAAEAAGASEGSSEPTSAPDDASTSTANPGSSGAAPGQSDPGPGNSDAAPGHSDAEQGASVGQGANAAAGAQQQGVGNTNVDVRIDKPGNGPPVSQENRAEGNADAGAAVETSTTPTTSDQSAAAAAETSQTDVQNTSVTVRVGSAGDDAGVDQANVADATASTTVVPPADGQSEVDESASATATQDGVTNTSVSIRVFSPGADGPVAQTNDAAAAADTSGDDGASATATQNDVQNTHVSVRVESSGTSGPVSQQSATSTTEDAGVAVATTRNGLDTDLSVVVDGDHLGQPGPNGLQVWIWTWNWDRDEADAVGASVDGQPSSWDWIWSGADGQAGQHGQVTTRAATQGDQAPGSWTWNWSWTREGAPNWRWQWDWQGSLPCASCVWIWNWTWNWTGQPAPTGLTTPPTETGSVSGGVEQANVVAANAVATVTADVTQTIAQDGDGEQFAGQLVTVDQFAVASASGAQSDVESVATANLLAPQVNRVTARAFATVAGDLAQRVEQTMLVDEDGAAAQWSGQEIDLAQHASADVRVTQRHVSVAAAGTHVAAGLASADAAADVDQRVAQDALVGGGETDQSAGQLTLVEQTGVAVSVVEQTDATAPMFVGGTANARSASRAVARVDQDVAQSAVRVGGLGSQTAMQIAYVGQTGVASATTSQRSGGASSHLASSDATAANRALVVQVGVQESSGALALDIQDLTQQSIVVQDAVAVSTSAGGIAGAAIVVNRAIVQQTAAQSLAGRPVNASGADLGAFCAPPSAAPAGGSGDETALTGTPSALSTVATASASVPPTDDLGVVLFHGRPSAAAPTARARVTTTPRVALVRPEPGAGRPVSGSPLTTRISVPPPTQARLDTRPGDQAGAGDAGREPPLPPAGDPPLWVSALAAAAAGGAGPSGIAAILVAFVLVPPLLVRAREGSVVRRPIEAFSQVDVPV